MEAKSELKSENTSGRDVEIEQLSVFSNVAYTEPQSSFSDSRRGDRVQCGVGKVLFA